MNILLVFQSDFGLVDGAVSAMHGVGFKHGDRVKVAIRNGSRMAYNNRIAYGKSFADVYASEQIIYVNSVYNMAIAINQGNFSKAYNIGTGRHWEIEFVRV